MTANTLRSQGMYLESLAVPEGTKFAMLVAGVLSFGMAKIYEAWTSKVNFELQIFKDQDEAVVWLRGKTS